MVQYSALFSQGQIGRLQTKNRIIMAPMVRDYADEDGLVTDKYVAHIERIARGGVGMMILEASFVRNDGRGFIHELGLHDDAVIPGFKRLVDAAHGHGAVIGPQIFHAGRQTSSGVTGMKPVAPSAIADPTIGEEPRALSVDEIHEIVDAFAQGARRAKDAGCDFVELHGAHGYLITQFLSRFSNKRDDEYGGSFDNRMRFLTEIFQAVRNTVGADFPITVRLSGDEMVPNGLTLADAMRIAKRVEALGVNAIHVSAGNYASYELGCMVSPMAVDDAPLVSLAEGVKRVVGIPVIAVGKIRDPELAESILQSGRADFIALGRSLLADPDWPTKAEQGRADTINKCIACNQGCITRLFDQMDVWCTVNPATSREREFDKPATQTKMKVFIAGGGPAGMEAAILAAGRGHHVVLCEADDHLGGQLIPAAAAPHRPGWTELMAHLITAIENSDIDVRLNTRATADMAKLEGADIAIVAIGSSALMPRIPGIEHKNVVTARDVLEGKVNAIGKVIVAGGGCAGGQTAEYLASKGFDVTIVEMLDSIAVDAPKADRELLVGRLHKLGVKVLPDTRILSIDEKSIGVERPEGLQTLQADTVVLCMGSVPNDSLTDELRKVVANVAVVGDAVEPRKVTEAMVEGALAGLSFIDAACIKRAA